MQTIQASELRKGHTLILSQLRTGKGVKINTHVIEDHPTLCGYDRIDIDNTLCFPLCAEVTIG